MEDDLANLALADEEEEAFQEDAAVFDQNLQLILVGRCLTDSIVHFPSLRNTMADLWHPIRGICISDLGERCFLFQFFHEVDIRRVLARTPWFFNNHLLLLHRIQSGENPSLVHLTFSEFWVQVHDLPPGLMLESMAKQFGEFTKQPGTMKLLSWNVRGLGRSQTILGQRVRREACLWVGMVMILFRLEVIHPTMWMRQFKTLKMESHGGLRDFMAALTNNLNRFLGTFFVGWGMIRLCPGW
ncbi:hypothetical protein Gotri_020033 [Gossypium trilobum]|uniref:DUF4283 domain-containing protein n=1 Tax=Gossypium trilobum TaxID=34281 RepID=A0A7J9D855_9ROSI|nr:hypothetical protein [Gossypium trilobum]